MSRLGASLHPCALRDQKFATTPCHTRPQVTAEVGQECLTLQERMRGGLLGAGHSWVASPLEPATHTALSGPDDAAAVGALDAVSEEAPSDAACAITIKAAASPTADQPGCSDGGTAGVVGCAAPGAAGAIHKAADATPPINAAASPAQAGAVSDSSSSSEAAAAPPAAAGLLRRVGRALSRRRFAAK